MLTTEVIQLMTNGKLDTSFVESSRLKFDRIVVEIIAIRFAEEGKVEVKLRHTFYKADVPVSFHDSMFMRIGDNYHIGELLGSIRISVEDSSGERP